MAPTQQETLSKYKFVKDKPAFTSSNYTVHHGTVIESNLPVTIKILKYPHVQLSSYLKKVKDCKSDNVIKIYQLVIEQQFLIMVTEQIIYGNLKKALQKCKYLDEPDAIFISKQLLNGHMDLLRCDANWFGTQQDLQWAQDGFLKLSWNNGCSFNLVNPFPAMIQRFSTRITNTVQSSQKQSQQSKSILPFPISKTLQQLIRISKQNASQISMNPQMKKKQKLPKKKGKGWIALKQYKNKNQYFDQYSYLAVHSQLGFVRVKTNQQGKISPNLLQLNKTKSSFVKIHEVFNQSLKSIIISDYSNDGNLQSYVLRLKTAGIKLKQDQIQFFVYSLLQPIKMVQDSSAVKAICMLHLKNIWIQNGIPKIGQPIPMNQKIEQVLADRRDVPDFYHPQFKSQPTLRLQKFDTYSLGVMLYRLMYGQMPIFPQPGKVHIPTAPSYNKRLKQSVQLFLTRPSLVRQIESNIQMSENVKKQIEQNKLKLKQGKQSGKKQSEKVENLQQSDEQHHPEQIHAEESSSDDQNGNPKYQQQEESSDEEQGPSIAERIRHKLFIHSPKRLEDQNRIQAVDKLELSSFKGFRIWSKVVLVFVLYICLFFYPFIANSVMMVAEQGLITQVNLNATSSQGTLNVSVFTTDRYGFYLAFNKTGGSLAEIQSMNCLVQGNGLNIVNQTLGSYSDWLKADSPIWYGYVFGGLVMLLVILLLKAIQIHTFDDINALYRRHEGQGILNVCNWILLNMHWLSIISGHYFLFHFSFYPQTEPCIGHQNGIQWGSTAALFSNQNSFIAPFVIVFVFQLLVYISYIIMINKNVQMTPKYNKIINTLSIFGALLLIIWFMVRFGIILTNSYYPAATNDHFGVIISQLKKKDYILFFAILPQVLWIIEMIILAVINFIYYFFFDKNNERIVANDEKLDASLNEIL